MHLFWKPWIWKKSGNFGQKTIRHLGIAKIYFLVNHENLEKIIKLGNRLVFKKAASVCSWIHAATCKGFVPPDARMLPALKLSIRAKSNQGFTDLTLANPNNYIQEIKLQSKKSLRSQTGITWVIFYKSYWQLS